MEQDLKHLIVRFCLAAGCAGKAGSFIISLGTNDAQAYVITVQELQKQMSTMLEKLKAASPQSAVLVTASPPTHSKRCSKQGALEPEHLANELLHH